jgi:RimJ/RimL family protein N-acetyltransferase
MHESTFGELLSSLNRGQSQSLTFNRPLLANVELAHHWTERKGAVVEKKVPDGSYTFYLIREFESGPYIGLVYDAGPSNLHWYSLPEYRGKGYLSQALRSVILPHLFQDNRELQKITINRNMLTEENFEASVRLAKSAGFEFTEEKADILQYQIEGKAFDNFKYIDGELSDLTDVRAEEIRSEISAHITLLEVLHSELTMKLGATEEIDVINNDLKCLRLKFNSVLSKAYEEGHIKYTNEL